MCRNECVEHEWHETQHARLRLPVVDPQLHTIYLVLNTWAVQGTHTETSSNSTFHYPSRDPNTEGGLAGLTRLQRHSTARKGRAAPPRMGVQAHISTQGMYKKVFGKRKCKGRVQSMPSSSHLHTQIPVRTYVYTQGLESPYSKSSP
jgi:hypothetical protein